MSQLEWRAAIRRLVRRPGSTIPTIVVLALGLALAGTALSPLWQTAVIDLPVSRSDRLVALYEVSGPRSWTDTPVSPANLQDWRMRGRALAGVAFHASSRERGEEGREAVVVAASAPELLRVLPVSANLFAVLGVRPAAGTAFDVSDAVPGAAPVAILSDALARRFFGTPAAAVGQAVRIENVAHQIRGVMPRGFWFPSRGVAIWTPLALPAADFQTRRQARILRVVARLADGVGLDRARDDLTRVAADLSREFPRTNGDTAVGIESLAAWLAGPRREPYRIAAACGGVLLLIALINAGLVARAALSVREREWAIARALGAAGHRLAAGVVVEVVLLAAMATALAWPLAAVLTGVATQAFGERWVPADLFDVRALLVVAAATTAGLALAMAGVVVRLVSGSALADDRRWTGVHRPPRRAGQWANAMQLALALVLACSAAGLVRGFAVLGSVPSGVEEAGAVAGTVTLKSPRFRDERLIARYFQDVLPRVRALPGVTAAGATAVLPLGGPGWTAGIWMPDLPAVRNVEVRQREITDGYVAAARLPLLEGREFTAEDSPAQPVVLVNAAFVRQICQGRSPIGLPVAFAAPDRQPHPWRVVGVVGDERLDPRDAGVVPIVYRLHQATPEETMTVIARTGGSASGLAPALRKVLADGDPEASVLTVESLDRAIGRSVARERAVLELSAIAAIAALVLACAGLYGVMALDVSGRDRELAVRMALGADGRQIQQAVWKRAMASVGAGLAGGGLLFWLNMRWLGSAFTFARMDWPTASLAIILTLCGCLAAVLPAVRRASRANPAALLRL
jgi:putative ABC transport system permease protein